MTRYTDAQALNFSAAYTRLKKARADEEYLVTHRDQIVGAEADGISDEDLIRALKDAYPEMQVTRRTLKRLRDRWAAHVAVTSLQSAEG